MIATTSFGNRIDNPQSAIKSVVDNPIDNPQSTIDDSIGNLQSAFGNG